jgi:hypothetical protein
MKIISAIMLAIVLLLAEVFCVNAEQDSIWKYVVTRSDGCKIYYDTESIVYLPNEHVTFWDRIVCTETNRQTISLKEIDCNSRTYRYLQMQMEYTGKDGFIYNVSEPSLYGEIEPETWIEVLYRTICKKEESPK